MFGLPPIFAHLVELLSLTLISGVAVGLGLRLLGLLRLIPPPPYRERAGVGGLSPGERLLFAFALGYGAFAYATFALGLLGLLYAPLVLALLLLFAAVGFRPLLTALREAIPVLRQAITGLRYPPSLFLALIILVTAIAALIKALAPPATQDDLMYHLALPARYVQQHAITFYPDSSYSLFPQTMEMLYSVGLLFGSDRLAVLLSFAISLVGPAAAALFAKRYLSDGAGVWRALPLLTAALFLTTPLIGFILRAANTDPPQASFDLLAGYAAYLAIANRASAEGVINHAPTKEGVMNHAPTKAQSHPDLSTTSTEGVINHAPTKAQSHPNRDSGRDKSRPYQDPNLVGAQFIAPNVAPDAPHPNPLPQGARGQSHSALSTQHSALMLSGACAGLALAVKYNGFAVGLAIGVALIAIIVYRRLSPDSGVRLLLAYGLPIALLLAPWLVRNWVASGNPVWPLASGIFGGAYSSLASSPAYLLGNAPPPGLSSLASGWGFIVSAITRPPLAIDNQLQVVSLGPLLLPLLLLLPLAKWQPALRWVAWLAAAYWLLWALFFSRTSARYLTSFFLFAAILSAAAVIALAARFRLLQWALGGVIAIALIALTLDTALSVADYLPTTLATDPAAEQQYLARYMEDYPMMQYLAASTPLTTTIYVWDSQPRGYYIPRRYVYARLVPLYSDFGDPNPVRWRNRLDELGVTYVLYHPRATLAPGLTPGYDPAAAAANAFSARYFGPPLFQSGSYTLYPLR